MTAPTPAHLAEAERIVKVVSAALEQGEHDTLRMDAALARIAERHAPTKTAWLGGDVDNCTECGQGYWPCGTFRDVAAAVGVEVPGE